jgi:hypothetical protein
MTFNRKRISIFKVNSGSTVFGLNSDLFTACVTKIPVNGTGNVLSQVRSIILIFKNGH